MRRKVCFMLFILLIFPTSISSQSDDLIELNFDSPISNVTWSPTGSKLAFVSGGTVQIYDRAEQSLQTIHLGDTTILLHCGRQRISSALNDGQ